MKKARKVPVAETPAAIDPREATRQYMERWQVVGPLLEGIRFWELHNKTAAQRTRDLEDLLEASDYRVPNDTSGWLAWQKVKERWHPNA